MYINKILVELKKGMEINFISRSNTIKRRYFKEIMKLKTTYNKIYKEFYKTQQPKRGRKPKA